MGLGTTIHWESVYGLSYSKHGLARFDSDSNLPSPVSHGAGNHGARTDHEHDAKHSVTYFVFVTFSVPGVGYPKYFLYNNFRRPLLSIYTHRYQ